MRVYLKVFKSKEQSDSDYFLQDFYVDLMVTAHSKIDNNNIYHNFTKAFS